MRVFSACSTQYCDLPHPILCGPVICPERSPGEPTTWTVTRARPTDDTSHLDLTAAASVPFTGLSKLDELTSPVTKATTPDYPRLPFFSPTTPTACNSTHLFATVCKSDKVSYLVDSTRPSSVLTEFGFYVRDVEVAGSNPVAPTFYKPCRIKNL